MSELSEAAVQQALVERLSSRDIGWHFVPGGSLDRPPDAVMIESEGVAALRRLNPAIATQPERVDEVLPKLRAAILSVANDGLVEANHRMVAWLRGQQTMRFVGTDDFVTVHLIDFESPRSNALVVSTEVTYHAGT